MKLYECLLVFSPTSGPDARKAEWEAIEKLMKKADAKLKSKEDWGKKPLGYAVKKFKEGNFIVAQIEMEQSKVSAFRKGLEIEELLLKFMLTVYQDYAPKKAYTRSKPASPEAIDAKPVPAVKS